jgi:hypothetical protein
MIGLCFAPVVVQSVTASQWNYNLLPRVLVLRFRLQLLALLVGTGVQLVDCLTIKTTGTAFQ